MFSVTYKEYLYRSGNPTENEKDGKYASFTDANRRKLRVKDLQASGTGSPNSGKATKLKEHIHQFE